MPSNRAGGRLSWIGLAKCPPLKTRLLQSPSWRAVWRNPANGTEALYIASHAGGARGMSDEQRHAILYGNAARLYGL